MKEDETRREDKRFMDINIKDVFNKPKIIGIVANVNEGKSMLTYNLIESLTAAGKFRLATYGLRCDIKGAKKIKSTAQLERLTGTIIFIDEFFSLFDLDNRKEKRNIERTLRLINHKNNILVLIGLGDNFKKYIASKLDMIFFKRVSFDNLINGSLVKNAILGYKGEELGSTLMDLAVDETVLYDCSTFDFTDVLKISYLEQYDSKRDNEPLIQ